jgi:hypothetical protein
MTDEDHAVLLEKYHRPERSKLVSRLTEYGETLIDPQYSKRDPKSDPAACPWRIRKSSHKRSGPGSLVRYRRGATVRIHEAPAHTRRPPVGHHRQTRVLGRSTRCRGRILVAKAPVAHQ